MANAPAPPPGEGQEEAPVKKGPGIIVWLLAAVVSGGVGFAVPIFLPMGDAGDAAKAASEETDEHGHDAAPAGHGAPAPSAHADSGHGGGGGHGASGGGHGSGGHGGGGHGAGGHGTTNPNATVAFVNFGDIVVNLDEGRLNRYLRLKIMLQVKPQDEGIVTTEMETQRTVLKSWLLSYLSDKTLSDIRGAAGQGMLRREIQEYFNTTLFPDGKDRVYDVLFDEFNIQ